MATTYSLVVCAFRKVTLQVKNLHTKVGVYWCGVLLQGMQGRTLSLGELYSSAQPHYYQASVLTHILFLCPSFFHPFVLYIYGGIYGQQRGCFHLSCVLKLVQVNELRGGEVMLYY